MGTLSAVQPALSQITLDRYLLDRLAEVSQHKDMVPLFARGDSLYIAIADAFDQALIREVQSRTGYSIVPRIATRREIRTALDLARGEGSLSHALASPLRAMLMDLWLRPDLVEHPEGTEPSVFDRAVDQGVVAGSDDASDPVSEAISMLLYLPRVRPERWEIAPWWSLLVSMETIIQDRVLPFLKVGSLLYVLSPVIHPSGTWRALEQATGYQIQPVICSLKSWAHCERLFGGMTTWIDHKREDDERAVQVTDPDVLAMADRIVATTREPREQVLRRLVREEQLRDDGRDMALLARLLEISRQAPLAPETLDRFPRATAERLGVVPFSQTGSQVRVATTRRDSERYLEAAAYLAERSVDSVRCSQADFQALLDQVYAGHRRSTQGDPLSAHWDGELSRVPLGEFLVRCDYISAERLRDALTVQQQSRAPLGEVLVSLGALTERDLLEALGLKFGIPYVDGQALRPSREAVGALDRDSAEELQALPVWYEPSILFVAVARPFGRELIDEIEQRSGKTVRPILATGRSVADAIGRIYATPVAVDWERLREFGQYLVRQRILTQEALQAAYSRVEGGTTVDIALAETGVAPLTILKAMGDFSGIESVSLLPVERVEEVFDSLGNRVTRIVKTDPVTPEGARLLPRHVAEQVPALALERRREGVVVAIPDPFEKGVVASLETALGTSAIPVLALRQQIVDAVRRTIGRKTLGDYLLEAGLITPDDLERALALSRNTGVRIGKAMLSLGVVGEDELVSYLANQHQMPLFDLSGIPVDEDVVRLLPEALERERGVVPLAVSADSITIGSVDVVDGPLRRTIEEMTERRMDAVLITEQDLEAALEQVYRFDYLERSRNELLYRSPEDSAKNVLSGGQKVFSVVVLVLLTIFAIWNGLLLLQLLIGATTVFYTMFSLYKFYLIYKALSHTLEVPITQEEVDALDDRDLPVYTILVPMYKEPEVLPILVRAIARMDYPKTKLEVLLLLEEDDEETIATARAQRLPSHFNVIVVPDGLPKGKPKACNYGLLHSRGEYCVIYDAEDLPDPDQLKKALLGFRKGGPNIACIQAKLNYFNRDQNLLTKWFTTEYSMWFDLFLPGLDASNAPIPLGGTSNHFRTAMLKELGGWDPYNVTEDADLGTRLFKLGWKTAVIDSTTYEEANSAVYNWIRQRSRWVKGYIQTWLVHMRNPYRLYRALGPNGFFSFQMVILGTFFGFLANPVFWILTALWFLTKWGLIQLLFPSIIFYLGAFSLYFGNFAFVYINVAGCLRREYYDMVKYALLSPAYWALMSIAAWKGFLQLFYAPSYWEKTQHGLYKGTINVAPANQLKDLI